MKTETYHIEYSRFSFLFVESDALSNAEKDVWDMKNIILKCIGGLPDNVKKIRISEFICEEGGDNKTITGLWRPHCGEIVISRCQLLHSSSFAATFLHELAHAMSNAADNTFEFEHEMTCLLGYLGSELVRLSKNNENNIQQANSLKNRSHASVECICLDCFGKDLEHNDDKSYVRCRTCGREYNGGYSEIVNLNRAYIEQNGLSKFSEDILKSMFPSSYKK